MLYSLLLVLLVPMVVHAQETSEVTVQVLYRGAVSTPQSIAVSRDLEVCGASAMVQTVRVHPLSHGLQDAVVTVEGAQTSTNGSTSLAPAVLSNSRCVFVPRVIGIQSGGSIEVGNQDPILHNTHIKAPAGKGLDGHRTLLNVALVPGGRPIVKKVASAGLYHVQCDAHPFMRGYIVARDHPFVAVSDEQGVAKIRGVPPGPYEVSIWHETLGELHSKVTVPSSGNAIVTVEFPSAPSTLRRQPD